LAAVTALDLEAGPLAGFTLWEPLRHEIVFGETRVEVRPVPGGADIRIGETMLAMRRGGDGWCCDGAKLPLRAIRLPDEIVVFGRGGGSFALDDPLDRGQGVTARGAIEAPMPGKVTAVYVLAGENVSEGQRLAVLEAMKMEHALVAPRDGVVAEVLAEPGDQIEAGAALVRLEEVGE
jgi:3-methylcrotonyl-CoA carboxylase alpha subunit